MNQEQGTAKTRREVWLSVALAVARDGLIEPEGLTVYGDNLIVSMTLHSRDGVRDWCAALGFPAADSYPGDGSLWGYGRRDGWSWQIRTMPEPVAEFSPLAEQVAAAILDPDSLPDTVLVVDGPDDERCPDPECGEPLALIAAGLVGHCGRECASDAEVSA